MKKSLQTNILKMDEWMVVEKIPIDKPSLRQLKKHTHRWICITDFDQRFFKMSKERKICLQTRYP